MKGKGTDETYVDFHGPSMTSGWAPTNADAYRKKTVGMTKNDIVIAMLHVG